VKIRKAVSSDRTGILECLHSAFAPYRHSYTPQAFDDTVLDAGTIHTRLQTMTLFVALRDAVVVGTIGCQSIEGEAGHLRGMAVRPECQGSNLARRLLDAAEEELVDRGCRRVTLDTTLPLQRAARFYEKNGYRLTGRTSDFFGMVLYEYEKTLEPK